MSAEEEEIYPLEELSLQLREEALKVEKEEPENQSSRFCFVEPFWLFLFFC
jgi:hypothetical protein